MTPVNIALLLYPVILFFMLFLFLFYIAVQSGLGGAGPIPAFSYEPPRILIRDDQIADSRTVWDILWSCLSTIFLCTWISMHPNLAFRPEKRDMGWWSQGWLWNTSRGILEYECVLFLWTLLVPEYTLAWAIRQYVRASQIQKQVPGWSKTQGFFMIMGGFHLYQLPDGAPSLALTLKNSSVSSFVIPFGHHSRYDEIPICPLQLSDVPVDVLQLIAPTEAELKDRGKSDWLAKLIVLMQTSWFIIRCIARGVRSLPLTDLEIITLAYATLNFFIYLFWWDKPRCVDCPIRVYKTSTSTRRKRTKAPDKWNDKPFMRLIEKIAIYTVGYQDEYVDLTREPRVPMFWSGKPEACSLSDATLGASILGAVFGALHCIAWSSHFPSKAELLLWRVSCIGMIAVPLIVTLVCAVSRLSFKLEGEEPLWLTFIFAFCWISLILSAWFYLAGRIATLVIAFTTLRALPSEAFTAVNWTVFIPHI